MAAASSIGGREGEGKRVCRSGGGGGGSGVARHLGDGRGACGRPTRLVAQVWGFRATTGGPRGGDADGSGGRDGMGGGELGGGERGGGGGLGWQRSMSSGIRISAASCSSPTVKLGSAAPALLRRLLQRGVRGTTEVGVPTANPASSIGLPRDARLLFIVLVSVAPRSSRRLDGAHTRRGWHGRGLDRIVWLVRSECRRRNIIAPRRQSTRQTTLHRLQQPQLQGALAAGPRRLSPRPSRLAPVVPTPQVGLSRGIQPATYDSFATSVVLLSTHCACARRGQRIVAGTVQSFEATEQPLKSVSYLRSRAGCS